MLHSCSERDSAKCKFLDYFHRTLNSRVIHRLFFRSVFRFTGSRNACRNCSELFTKTGITPLPITNICWTAAWSKLNARSQQRWNTWQRSTESPIRVCWCWNGNVSIAITFNSQRLRISNSRFWQCEKKWKKKETYIVSWFVIECYMEDFVRYI